MTLAPKAPSLRLLTALLVVGVLWWAQDVVIPFVISVLISYALEPVVARLERWHIRRVLAVPVLMTALILGALGAGYALRAEATAFAVRLPGVTHALAQGLRAQAAGRSGTVARMQQAATELERATASARNPLQDGVASVRVEEPAFRWREWLWQGSHSLVLLGIQMIAVLCLVYCLLVSGDRYRRKVVRAIGTSLTEKRITVQILGEIERQIERFIWARALISLIVGLAVGLSFSLMGLEEPGVWGVIAGILVSVPFVGPTVMVLGAGIAGFVQFNSFNMAAAAAGVCLAIAAIEGNILMPWLLSRAGEMNGVAVFVSLMFWGWLWGVWGLLLAVPITAAIKAVCERVEDLNGFAEMLKQ